MKVWVFEVGIDYEGDSLASVHATKEGAMKAAQESVDVPLEWEQRRRSEGEWWVARIDKRAMEYQVSEYDVLP